MKTGVFRGDSYGAGLLNNDAIRIPASSCDNFRPSQNVMSSTDTHTTPKMALADSVTWRMWVPCMTMAACSWLSFFHRSILAALAPTILKETGLTAQQFASINAYFFVAYTLGNPLWGSILDYVGLRVGMILGVTIWTAASVSHGWAGAFIGFAVVRAVLGLGEGVTFPGGFRTA